MYNVKTKDALSSTNDKINELFEKSDPFSVIRIGNMEGYFLDCFNKQTMPLQEFFYWLTLTSGVYPHDMHYLVNTWAEHNYQAMVNSDVLGFVDISGHVKLNEDFNNKYTKGKHTFYGEDEILVLDPGYLTNCGLVDVPCEDPWTRNLKGKKVLVVSNFEDTINEQWPKIKEIWGDKYEDIAAFDLVGVVRSPFHPMMDDRQYPHCDTWDKTLKYMQQEMDKHDYDVALVSAAAWAPALANHAKNTGKIGLTICGTLQLYFGIIGSRWAGNNRLYTEWPKMFNEHWKWANEIDLPKNKDTFNKFEKAYWK